MSHTRLHSGIALLVGGAIFAAAYWVPAALTGTALLTTRNLTAAALLGAVSSASLFVLLRHVERRHELLRRQLHEAAIDDLNHHIRNALQMIVNEAEILRPRHCAECDHMREAVTRIDWALREILPFGYPALRQIAAPYRRPVRRQLSNSLPHTAGPGASRIVELSANREHQVQITREGEQVISIETYSRSNGRNRVSPSADGRKKI